MARKSKLLENLGKELENIKLDNIEDLDIDVLKDITICMRDVTDYRHDVSYHKLENIIMIVFIALLGNCNEWEEIYNFGLIHEEWFKRFLDLKYGIPSVTTLRVTMSLIEPEEIEEVCVNYIIKIVTKLEEITNYQIDKKQKETIAYDGKVCRGSKRENAKGDKIKPVNAMSAYNVDKDICLATKFIEDKTNEIPTGPELVNMLDLTNTISVFDAMNTQEKTIKAIVDKGGNYVAAVKGNQKSLFADIKKYFKDKCLYEEAKNESCIEESEKAHNCEEKRTYIMTSNIDWLDNKSKWKNIKSIGLVTREYTLGGRRTIDTRYYITDLSSNEIKDFAKAVRDEWGIENNLHWHLDYTLREDYSLTVNKKVQANLNILRKLCLNILKLVKPFYNKSLKLIRFLIGQNFSIEINKIFSYLNTKELEKIISKTQ